jgi:hypothetical protein
MTTALIFLLALTIVLAVGSIFVLLLNRLLDERREHADIERLRKVQYRMQAFDREGDGTSS